jgi:hypothetical protein
MRGTPEVRIKSKWYRKARPKTPEELAGAAGFIAWRVADHHVEQIELAGFELHAPEQRFAILAELLIFLVQAADRMVYERLDEEQRRRFVTAMALHVAGTLEDNQRDHLGPGDYRQAFIDRFNAAAADYAELSWGDDGPGYRFKRYLGERVLAIVGSQAANKWVIDQVMEIEAPAAIEKFAKSLEDLLATPEPPAEEAAEQASGAG